jgi:hypothetical protein
MEFMLNFQQRLAISTRSPPDHDWYTYNNAGVPGSHSCLALFFPASDGCRLVRIQRLQTPDTGVVSSTSFASYRSLAFHIHFSNILYESCILAASWRLF